MLEVICGPMFSGKTEELIRRARRMRIAQRRVCLLKHAKDDRFDPVKLVTHGQSTFEAQPVGRGRDLLLWGDAGQDDWGLVGVDEFQFFDDSAIEALEELRRRAHVVVAGLDLDSAGRPFGPMPAALALADRVTKLTAVCMKCGADATRSYRRPDMDDGKVVQVGAGEAYEARCLACWRLKP